jgi:hypothetical protein
MRMICDYEMLSFYTLMHDPCLSLVKVKLLAFISLWSMPNSAGGMSCSPKMVLFLHAHDGSLMSPFGHHGDTDYVLGCTLTKITDQFLACSLVISDNLQPEIHPDLVSAQCVVWNNLPENTQDCLRDYILSTRCHIVSYILYEIS